MNMTGFFIKRPVMTVLVVVGFLFFGVVAYQSLPVSYLPSVEFPTIQVSAYMPGANARTVAETVASPLEREFSSISGLNSLNSKSSHGRTTITLQFDLSRHIDDAAMDVQAAITAAGGSLPDTISGPPSFQKVNPADQPVLYIAFSSPTLPLSTLNEYIKSLVTQTLSMVPGVAQVAIHGEQKYAVRIRLDPRALAVKGLGINEVRRAVSSQNVNLPIGTMEGKDQSITLNARGQLNRAEAYGSIIVSRKKGQPVRLMDLGRISDGVETEHFSSWHNGERVLIVAVKRQPGSNTIQVVDAIKKKLPHIMDQLPASIHLNIIHDTSDFIRDSVGDVQFTLFLAVALVVLIVSLFLRNLAGTIIAGMAIPFSIIITFVFMKGFHFTLDTLSLMALTLSVGFVVDDAIVMLENIVRHVEMGKKPLQAAMDGAREIGFTIVSMSLSLAVVFIPVLFMSGIIGRVMHEFAMTIIIAILVSGVISLSLTPMLSSRLLGKGTRLGRSGPIFTLLLRGYRVTLRYALDHRLVTMILFGVILASTAYLFVAMPKGFLPSNDMNYFFGFTRARQGIPYTAMLEHQQRISPVFRNNPNVLSENQVIGYPLENQGMTFVILKPRDQRDLNVEQVIGSLWPRVNTIPGLEVFLVNPPMIQIGGRSSKGAYQFTLQSTDTRLLYQKAKQFVAALSRLPQFMGVSSDLEIGNPELDIRIDRDHASMLGVTVLEIENALYTAYGPRDISTIFSQNDDYKVMMELLPEFQEDPSAISMLYLRSSSGKLVRLDSLASYDHAVGPVTVNHTGQLPSVTVSFNARSGYSLGDVTRVVEEQAEKILPNEISTRFEGTAEAFQKSMKSLYFLLFLAIAAIYIILGCLYESFLHPLTILSGLPSAAFGGLLTLALFGLPLNLYGFVGIIMLLGIVKKNSIMVVDFAIGEEKKGVTPTEAAFQGSLVRFRPVMMTTMAAIMGALPIAVGFGAGGEARRPLGLVVVGGLVLSQVVTLYLTPVVYSYMNQLQKSLKRS